MMLFYLVFRENVISMFIDDAEVVSLGVKMLTAIMSPGPVIGIMFVLNFAFQGMGKGIQSFILSVGRQGLVYIPLLFILNKLVGLDWNYLGTGNSGFRLCNNEYYYVHFCYEGNQ